MRRDEIRDKRTYLILATTFQEVPKPSRNILVGLKPARFTNHPATFFQVSKISKIILLPAPPPTHTSSIDDNLLFRTEQRKNLPNRGSKRVHVNQNLIFPAGSKPDKPDA